MHIRGAEKWSQQESKRGRVPANDSEGVGRGAAGLDGLAIGRGGPAQGAAGAATVVGDSCWDHHLTKILGLRSH